MRPTFAHPGIALSMRCFVNTVENNITHVLCKGHVGAVEALLKGRKITRSDLFPDVTGIDLAAVDCNNRTSLLFAAKTNQEACIMQLLESGKIDVNQASLL